MKIAIPILIFSLFGCGGPMTACQTIFGQSHEVYTDKCPDGEVLVGQHQSQPILYCATMTINCPVPTN